MIIRRGVSGMRIRNVKTGETEDHAVDGVFIAIGHDPNTNLFKGQLDMDDEGYLLTQPDSTKTSVDGVFAAGDVQDKCFPSGGNGGGNRMYGGPGSRTFPGRP